MYLILCFVLLDFLYDVIVYVATVIVILAAIVVISAVVIDIVSGVVVVVVVDITLPLLVPCIAAPLANEEASTRLNLTILEANSIAYSTNIATKNHYCIISVGQYKCRTPSVKAKCWPTWNYKVLLLKPEAQNIEIKFLFSFHFFFTFCKPLHVKKNTSGKNSTT